MEQDYHMDGTCCHVNDLTPLNPIRDGRYGTMPQISVCHPQPCIGHHQEIRPANEEKCFSKLASCLISLLVLSDSKGSLFS